MSLQIHFPKYGKVFATKEKIDPSPKGGDRSSTCAPKSLSRDLPRLYHHNYKLLSNVPNLRSRFVMMWALLVKRCQNTP